MLRTACSEASFLLGNNPSDILLIFSQMEYESNRVAWMIDSLCWIWKVRLDCTLTATVQPSKCSRVKRSDYFCLKSFEANKEKKSVFLDWPASVSLVVYAPGLCSCGYILYMVTNQTWQSCNVDRSDILFPAFYCTLYFLSFWTLLFEGGVAPQVWFFQSWKHFPF